MDVKIINEQENNLFNRKEVHFEVIHEGAATPSLSDVRLALAQKIGSDSSRIVIDKFETLFGIGRTIGTARSYKEITDLKEYEPSYLLKRNKLISEEKKEEKPAEAPEPKKEEKK